MDKMPIQALSPTTYEQLIPVLKALAEPNRLRIFNHLMQGDSCNCELGDALELAPNLLSHHLRVLSKAGLVQARRDSIDKRWIYYAVAIAQVDTIRAMLHDLFDTTRCDPRPQLCGPEGQLAAAICATEATAIPE